VFKKSKAKPKILLNPQKERRIMPTKKAPAKRVAKSTKVKANKSVMVPEETAAERRKRLAEEKKIKSRK
jgi:hypothetical protein